MQTEQKQQAAESVTPREKLHQIADELLKTERTYVARLRLLHEVRSVLAVPACFTISVLLILIHYLTFICLKASGFAGND